MANIELVKVSQEIKVETRTVEVPDATPRIEEILKQTELNSRVQEERFRIIDVAGNSVVDQIGAYLYEFFKPYMENKEVFEEIYNNMDSPYKNILCYGNLKFVMCPYSNAGKFTFATYDESIKIFFTLRGYEVTYGEENVDETIVRIAREWGHLKKGLKQKMDAYVEHIKTTLENRRETMLNDINALANFEL